jgi:ribosomal protein S11
MKRNILIVKKTLKNQKYLIRKKKRRLFNLAFINSFSIRYGKFLHKRFFGKYKRNKRKLSYRFTEILKRKKVFNKKIKLKFTSFRLLKKRIIQKVLFSAKLRLKQTKKQRDRRNFSISFLPDSIVKKNKTLLTFRNFLLKQKAKRQIFKPSTFIPWFKRKKSVYFFGRFVRVIIVCSLNNVFVTVSQPFGFKKVLYKISAGFRYLKLKGSVKGTPFASQMVGKGVGRFLKRKKIKNIVLFIKSRVNARTRSVVKGLVHFERLIRGIFVRYKLAHNGCRKKGLRRV